MKTQKTTTKQDNRSLEQVAKSVAAMRRRVGAAVRKHNKLQERIARLEKQGRIVNLSHDYEVLAGINCWYVKAESLNPNPDSNTNYYYETTYNEQAGYGCSCESLSPQGCKHIRQLGATFAPVAKEEQEVQAYFLGLCKTQPETKKLSAEEANQFFMEQAEKRNQAPLNGRNAGFQLMR